MNNKYVKLSQIPKLYVQKSPLPDQHLRNYASFSWAMQTKFDMANRDTLLAGTKQLQGNSLHKQSLFLSESFQLIEIKS